MHILVVDPNVAFGTLLSEELKRLGYSVDQVSSGVEAFQSAQTEMPDLAILDMALEEPDVLTLARALRDLDDTLRLVVIPLIGESLDIQSQSISLQGVLPKPFFLPELATRINAALGIESVDDTPNQTDVDVVVELDSPVPEEYTTSLQGEESLVQPAVDEPAIAESAFSYERFQKNEKRINELLGNLIFDVGADGAVFAYEEKLLTWVGGFSDEEAESITTAVVSGWRTSAEVARILGREQLRFEQSTAGGSYMLYALSIDINAIMAVAIRGTATLGMIRHRAREVAGRITKLCSTY